MIKLSDLIKEDLLTQKLITFNNRTPKYDNIIMLAGGPGSGKGFVKSNLVGMQAKTIDTDEFKKFSLKTKSIRDILAKDGVPVDNMDFKNPQHVQLLHNALKKTKLENKYIKNLMGSMSDKIQKDNIIFDTTLKEFPKIGYISKLADTAGYKKENIHIVWVLTPMETASAQNKQRERRVKEEVLESIHQDVGKLMAKLIGSSSSLNKYADGDFWIVFNDGYNDTIYQKSSNGGGFIKQAIYIKIKKAGKPMMKLSEIANQYYERLLKYVPNPEDYK